MSLLSAPAGKGTLRFLMCGLLAAVAGSSIGCSGPKRVEELYGTYVAEYPFMTDTLVLKADGTYVQRVLVRTEPRELSSHGHWTYVPAANRVELDNVLVVTDEFGNLRQGLARPQTGVASFPVERGLLSRRLRLGPDEGTPYRKLSE